MITAPPPPPAASEALRVDGAGSRAERLATALEDRIRDLDLPPGAAVGTLDDLRSGSGFSRPTVGEAVRLLRDRGVLHVRPGRGGGLFVAERGPVVRLRHTLLEVSEDPGTVADAVELREHLELLVDLGAARHADPTDVDDLRRLVGTLGRTEDWSSFMAANWALHERIAAISPNAMARAVYTATLGHLADATTAATSDAPDAATAAAHRARRHAVHVDLVEAIALGDEDLVRAAVARHGEDR